MKTYTKTELRALVDALPENYRTPDLDGIIRQLVREGADVSCLRPFVLAEQDLHRIYYYVNLKQLRDVNDRMQFIHENLLFSDWWHTDQLIGFIKRNPSVLKRPIIVSESGFQVGYDEEEIGIFVPAELRRVAENTCTRECPSYKTCEKVRETEESLQTKRS